MFICSSATIANPRELAERLTGRPFELVDESGAPRGEKFFLFVNPPVVNAAARHPALVSRGARRVALEFLKRNLQLIVFAQSRLATEILTTYLKDAFRGPAGRGGRDPRLSRRLSAAPAARDRARPARGQVRAVVSTNALELGIDIGALDVAVMAGYPGTIAATWQRAGRAGRRTAVGGGARREQRADRSVHHPQPVVLLRRLARARADQPRQPAHPARSREVRGVRAAVRAPTSSSAANDVQEILAVLRRGRLRPLVDARRRSGTGRTSRIRPTPSACGRCRPTTSSSSTRPTASASSARPTSPAARRRCTRRRSTSSKASCSRSSASTSTAARRSSARSTATTTPTRSRIRR